ncbi:MAG TPA: hypothetical protein VKK79_07560 [Candidatus Lokiarchaeia archaeon]|nr:hypothetical protein [Candidatus Lokiarchaeia archaeon]
MANAKKTLGIIFVLIAIIVVFLGRLSPIIFGQTLIWLWGSGFAILAVGAVLIYYGSNRSKTAAPQQQQADLRKSPSEKKVAFQIDVVTDDVTAAIEALGYNNIEIDGNKILIALKNPGEENPTIVEAIIAAGGHVKRVSEVEANAE